MEYALLPLRKQQVLPGVVGKRAVESSAVARIRRCRPAPRFDVVAQIQPLLPCESLRAQAVTALPPVLQDSDARVRVVDPLYLFACKIEWEHREEPSAAWELIAAAHSGHADTSAQARALLASSRHVSGASVGSDALRRKRQESAEKDMTAPYDLEIVDNCADCTNASSTHFCRLSDRALDALSEASHKSVVPAGAILFVEGQVPRGMFTICSGRVNLSTTSREGKSLILKTAEAGEALGLSATVSGMGYEVTAETATPCLLSFIDRKHYLELMEAYGEIGIHTAQCLSRDFQSAHRDIHDLILTRSSSGKLARLLLSQFPQSETDAEEHSRFVMTHEEIALRIGASRETVTRLLGRLRRKRLISLDGSSLTIRDRQGLQELAV